MVTLLNAVPVDTVVGLAANDLLTSGVVQPPIMGNSSAVAVVKPSVTVYAGHPDAQFTITTNPNSVPAGKTRSVQISAAAGSFPVSAILKVEH